MELNNQTSESAVCNCVVVGNAAGANLRQGRNCVFIGEGAGTNVESASNRLIIKSPGILIDRTIAEDDAIELANLLNRILNS